MTPPDNIPAATKDHDGKQGSDDNRKTTSTRPPEQGLKCPRCNSPNTKFCYYNNYSLTQPRHFCKSCRRYWTKGGSLRNVPLGGGCRKNKKGKSLPSSSSSRLSFDSRDSSGNSSSELLGGFKLFEGLSPSLDLQGLLPFPPKLHHHQYPPTTGIYTQFSSFGDTSASATTASCFQLDTSRASNSLIGPNYNPLFPSSTGTGFNGAIQGTNSMNIHGNLAFSIESLSSINQDLHWKLQQQRLAMKLSGDNQKDSSSVSLSPVNLENQTQQQPHPILFQNLEISKPEIFPATGNSRKEGPSGDKPTEWFFGNSYSSVTPTPTTSSGGDGHDNASNNWGGVNAWGDVQQPYKALP